MGGPIVSSDSRGTEQLRRRGHALEFGGKHVVTTTYSPAGISLDRSTDRLTSSGQAVTDARVRRRMHESRKGGDKVMSFFTYLIQLRKREEGQTMAEYGVVLAVITLGVVLALGILSGAISGAIEEVADFL